MLGIVAIFTLFFVWAFGHALAWSVIGCLFGAVPLIGLLLTVGVGLRAAVAAGPGWVGVRFLRRWRVIDLGQVRAVRLAHDGPFPGFGRFGGLGPMGPRGTRNPMGPYGGGPGGGTLVFEDLQGGRVDIGVDALDGGLAAVVRAGLAPDAEVDPGAARALDPMGELGSGSGDAGNAGDAGDLGDAGDAGAANHDDPVGPESEPGIGHRP
jgi:hypothetical protein